MDPAAATENTSSRPRRDTRLPPHLMDYEVGFSAHGSQPPITSSSSSSRLRSTSRRSHSSITNSSSHSGGRHTTYSVGRYPQDGLSPIQSAILEENAKQLQLANLQRQLEEDAEAERELQRLQAQAKAAQQAQEEAIQAREAVSKRLDQNRRLQQLQADVELAKLVTSMLSTNSSTSSTYQPRPPATPAPGSFALPHSNSRPPRINPIEAATATQPLPTPTAALMSVDAAVPKRNLPQINMTQVSSSQQTSTPQTTQTQVVPHYDQLPASHRSSYHNNTAQPPLPKATQGWEQPRASSFPVQAPTPAPAPYPGLQPQLGADLLIASAFGIPKPTLPVFESGRESDFALLKMALDSLLNNHSHLSEHYKYQVLLSHLKLPSALQLAKAYMHHVSPYTEALNALQEKYGQPRQLIQSELGAILNSPALKISDANSFDSFALSVQSLVGMLRTLEGYNGIELMCGSHVDRLLSKLPPPYRDSFVEYCLNRGILQSGSDRTYTLPDLATWLQVKSQAKRISSRAAALYQSEPSKPAKTKRNFSSTIDKERSTPVLLTAKEECPHPKPAKPKPQPYCPHCDNKEHYLNSCENFKKLTPSQITQWIKDGNRCWKCGRSHPVENCNLKRPCKVCQEQHLTVLHDSIHETSNAVLVVNPASTKVYLDRPNRAQRVMLKVVKILIHHAKQTMEAYAILDDGSERTIILSQALQSLKLPGVPETLPIQTIHQNVRQLQGFTVSFEVSPLSKPNERYLISNAFSADGLCFAEHHYPIAALQQAHKHLRGIPLQAVNHVHPLILIGSDMCHLITPVQPTVHGPPDGPVAVCTRLGWCLQGPMTPVQSRHGASRCLHISTASMNTELLQHVQRLWQLDTLPYCEKAVTRSKLDQQALSLLQASTVRVDTGGASRYATPLLRRSPPVPLHAPREAALPSLRSTERRLAKDPSKAATYCAEIQKLEVAGYVAKITPEEAHKSTESWYVPHHLVHHNGKDRIVFNCSFQYKGQSLNEQLLPGPTLGPTLLGVLLRFRQHSVAISGDIRSMFHQVLLLAADKPIMRFLWRNMQRDAEPEIYEWQVLPFGTTCSPCCATYALQRHVEDSQVSQPELAEVVTQAFYVDNCLYSTPDPAHAKAVVDGLRNLLAKGGFEIRQWASNLPSVIEHLPSDARSVSSELWLSRDSANLDEHTLGLQWNCLDDTMGYRHRSPEPLQPTMRNLYKTLASQYDPLGFIIPFTTTAKVLIQDLWKQDLSWDDPIEHHQLKEQWMTWVDQLPNLPQVQLPRAYTPPSADTSTVTRQLHVFCDASERAYGSAAYLRTTDDQGKVHVAFVLARSRVAPKKCLSMPRLELSAALTGAQLVKLLETELTIPIHRVVCWSDSTTVLHWLQSESCRYKVFVGTRVAEIQTLTDSTNWRYVDSPRNPADHITRGLTLKELLGHRQWRFGPKFLSGPPDQWPTMPNTSAEPDHSELKKSSFIGAVSEIPSLQLPDPSQFPTWTELVKATVRSRHGAADAGSQIEATDFTSAERALFVQAQAESFPAEVQALKALRPFPSGSRLGSLAPEYEPETGLVRVGGRLRRATDLDVESVHPIVLDPKHSLTKLLIKDCDERLHHPGTERVLAELRRQFWILRGREAIRKHQYSCRECQFWRAKPQSPRMADLPPARLRLYKPPFYSVGVDCFGPFLVKIGRRREKRWGILFKCMTTRCLHLDLLESLDSDAFLLCLRRFVARRGRPFEVLCDNGTNFTGGSRELQEAFQAMSPQLQAQLAEQKIQFRFNPPAAPHFGGTWEREVRSIKASLRVVLKEQVIPEPVLRTLLIEVEGILNAKPLGYVSTDIADPDPITPNMLLMGRRDSSLPQAIYDSEDLLGRRRWRHSQVLADNFWSSFVRQYLPGLQDRPKWQSDSKELTVGQVVLVVDPRFPRASWPVGTITETFPAPDGRVRTAAVKVREKIYTRPVIRLIPLPRLSEEDNGDRSSLPEDGQLS
ncbi:uncharacterized protein LOC144016825 [Festucalex cinctus]